MDRQVIGKRIAEFRTKAVDMSEKEFADLMGVSVKRLQNVESGKAELKIHELCALADAFGVSMDYFLGIHKRPHPVITDEKSARFWLSLDKLSDEELKEVLEEAFGQLDMEEVVTICYGKKETWESRAKAKAFFLEAMAGSEGSEHQRYETIYHQLCVGMKECSDEVK